MADGAGRPRWTSFAAGTAEAGVEVSDTCMTNPMWAQLRQRKREGAGEETNTKSSNGEAFTEVDANHVDLTLLQDIEHDSDDVLPIEDVAEDYINLSNKEEDPKEHKNPKEHENPKEHKVERCFKFEDLSAPWTFGKRYPGSNRLISLHEEILDFVQWISPTQAEAKIRSDLVSRVQNVVSARNERYQPATADTKVEIKAFGSFITDLYLPSSDVDMVLTGVKLGPTKSVLYNLAFDIKKAGVAKSVEVIANARVPIIKFVDSASGLSVDICFNNDSGFHAAKIVNKHASMFVPFRPLVMVLKFFLAMRELNETYTGGVGSFVLQMMVVGYLKLRYKTRDAIRYKEWPEKASEMNLAAILMDFFKFFGGTEFNYEKVGLIVTGNGGYYDKRKKGRFNGSRPWALSLESPLDPSLDIGANSFMMGGVRKAFDFAYRQLLALTHPDPKINQSGRTILGHLLGGAFAHVLGQRRGKRAPRLLLSTPPPGKEKKYKKTSGGGGERKGLSSSSHSSPKYNETGSGGLRVTLGSGVRKVKLLGERRKRKKERGTNSTSIEREDDIDIQITAGFSHPEHPGRSLKAAKRRKLKEAKKKRLRNAKKTKPEVIVPE
ncbi:hypothetical protein AAMO2058_001118800 [Amorphochlora amoebiformis]